MPGRRRQGRGPIGLKVRFAAKGELIDSVRGGTVVLHMPEIAAKVDGTVSAGREDRFADDALVALAARRGAGGAGDRSGGEEDGQSRQSSRPQSACPTGEQVL